MDKACRMRATYGTPFPLVEASAGYIRYGETGSARVSFPSPSHITILRRVIVTFLVKSNFPNVGDRRLLVTRLSRAKAISTQLYTPLGGRVGH